jgi:hypothetical protein
MAAGPRSGSLALLTTSPNAWTATSDSSWLQVSTTNGVGSRSIWYGTDANSSVYPRSGSVVVSDGASTVAFVVVQQGAPSSAEDCGDACDRHPPDDCGIWQEPDPEPDPFCADSIHSTWDPRCWDERARSYVRGQAFGESAACTDPAAQAPPFEGFGIFLKGHPTAKVARHASLRIIPTRNAVWHERLPSVFSQTDAYGHWFATIGAASDEDEADSDSSHCGGTLLNGINRPTDVGIPHVYKERLTYLDPNNAFEDALIQSLLLANGLYSAKLMKPAYSCTPPLVPGTYNSNSFAHGLIRAAGSMFPPADFSPTLFVGWNQAVPIIFFQ